MKRGTLKITRLVSLFFICFAFFSCSSPDNSDEELSEIIEENDDVTDDDSDTIEYTTVNTIAELNATLNQNDVNIKLAAGTYKFGPDDVASGLIPNYEMFVFRGKNTNYDFTGVTFEFDTQLFREYGNEDVVQIRLYGENITVKNLTMIDIGDAYPLFRANNINLDGVNNTIDGFSLTARGSYPYGYGDLFGKGGPYTIKHYKHSGILIRGERNTLKNTTILSKSYGHIVFIQGGKDVLIEDCYIEGDEMRKTDDILAEKGTGSPADNVNFMTVFGYTVPPGFMISMQEEGFRAYRSAEHYSGNGETSTTENVTIRNCTAKHVRGAFNLVFAEGTTLIENCTSIENEEGFSIQKGGQIIDCKSDAKFGPALTYAYDSDNNVSGNITITNNEGSYGTHPIAYIGGGSGQNITINSEETDVSQDKFIQLGGVKVNKGLIDDLESSQNNHKIISSTIINNTKFPIKLTNLATGNNVYSCGTITDDGASNTTTSIDCN